LRAAVLGANDGLISTSSLIMGVAAAQLADATVFLAGLAGLVGGALSMAAGEYVSVSSQDRKPRSGTCACLEPYGLGSNGCKVHPECFSAYHAA
jgi:hypothetical protein